MRGGWGLKVTKQLVTPVAVDYQENRIDDIYVQCTYILHIHT